MTTNTISYDDFTKVNIRAGVITAVEDFPRAKNPSYKVTVDFGLEIGVRKSSVQAAHYSKEELTGMSVVGVVNFPAKNIAGFMSEALILGVKGVDGKVSLLSPTRPTTAGEAVY